MGLQNSKESPEEAEVEDTDQTSASERSLLQKVLHRCLVENSQDLEINKNGPHSPFHSVKTFEALNL